MRRGIYTNYNGKDYRVVFKKDGTITLCSKDESDMVNGFEPYYPEWGKNP